MESPKKHDAKISSIVNRICMSCKCLHCKHQRKTHRCQKISIDKTNFEMSSRNNSSARKTCTFSNSFPPISNKYDKMTKPQLCTSFSIVCSTSKKSWSFRLVNTFTHLFFQPLWKNTLFPASSMIDDHLKRIEMLKILLMSLISVHYHLPLSKLLINQ